MSDYNGNFYNNSYSGEDFANKWKENMSKKKPKHVRAIIILAICLLALITVFGSGYSYLMEYWQIKEIGEKFLEVFWKNISYQLITQAVGFVIFFAIIYINLFFFKKFTLGGIKSNSFLNKRWPHIVVSIFLAYYLSGALSSDLYKQALLALNGGNFNMQDPLFSRDIGYYIFTRPFAVSLIASFKNVFLFIAILAAVIYYFTKMRAGGKSIKDFFYTEKGAVTHVIANLLIYFIFLIFSYRFAQEGIMYESFGRDNIIGAGFIEANIWLVYYKIAPYVLIAAVILTVLFLYKRKYILTVSTILVVPAIYILTALIAFGVEEIVVSPNERNIESPYISYNMEATKNAYKLNDIVEIDYDVATNLTAADIAEEKETIENIRITDFGATLTAYNQLQYLRKYYSFNDVDVVPYNIDGDLTAVSLAPRELNKDNIDEAARSYTNKTFRYTHGFGVVVSPINRVTDEGQPAFFVKNIPTESTGELPNITQPRIYYGELTNDYVIVGGNNKELDYSEGTENFENTYDGEGGDNLSFVKRVMYSLYYRDFKMLVSGNINSNSKILINRNIMKRVKMAVPFLAYDEDPYMIIDDNGRLVWAIDAYTYSSQYPYSQRFEGINYLRNSVKVIVDAYNGDVKFYQIDFDDPIINAYVKMYPGVFEEGKIDSAISSHIRTPEYMFKAQTNIYGKYHVSSAEKFYDKDDVWQIALEKYQNNEVAVEAYFTVANFDGKDELVLVQPYVLEGRHNMVGILMTRTNKDHYGELVLYRMPKSRTIYGPMQIENKIDNDPDISREMTLWSNAGSSVIRGNLIVVPFRNSLIYVEPVYITSQNNASLPELKRVVVAYNNEVAMEATIEEAMAKVFSKGYLENESSENISPESIDQNNEDIVVEATDAVNKVISAYEQFKIATKDGDFASMGKHLEELDKVMDELKKEQ